MFTIRVLNVCDGSEDKQEFVTVEAARDFSERVSILSNIVCEIFKDGKLFETYICGKPTKNTII